ncbi:MAG: serine/threonine-protein kinase, partial [Myxococcales bacterium]|nr:serine/threonine-protein kinase [Myxococcales bacterium]
MIPEQLGSYEVKRLLGRGGMGEVYLAHDSRLGRDVALKLLPAGLAKEPALRERFLREARAVAALNHPGIATIHEIGEADGRDFLAFEYVEGGGFDALPADRKPDSAELIDWALAIAEALEFAHSKGVVHRDLKPANVMLSEIGRPKLLDFGLAKLLHEPADENGDAALLTQEGDVLGTPAFMSPEQARGQPIDSRTDVFSFGSLLYRLAAGTEPFSGSTALGTMSPSVLNGAGVEVVKDEALVFGATRVRQLLWEQEIQGGRAVAPGRILLEGESRDRQPVYAHDGSRIRFASNRTGNLDLWEFELGSGRLRQLTDDRAQDWDPGFAADGEGILWSSDRSGAFEVWSAAGDGSGARQLSDDGLDAENPTAAPGGDWVVYASANPEKFGVWRMREDGTSPEMVVAGDYVQPEISSDGRWAGILTLEPHNLRNVVRFVEVETGRLVPFEIHVRADRDRAIVPGRMRWVSDCALSQEPAIAFVGV